MSILGTLFGYDSRGNDLLGFPERKEDACVACGVAANAHTPAMTMECLSRLFGDRRAARPAEKGPAK